MGFISKEDTMKKLLLGAVIGALIGAGAISFAAVNGRPPPQDGGFRLMDSQWVLGIAQGINAAFSNGNTCLGTTQATGAQLPANTQLYDLDTVASGTGCNLPFAFTGTVLHIYNNGLNTATIFPNVINNPVTAAQDTINNTTSFSLASHVKMTCMVAKDGVWGCQ
jgi:hypothetical protein